MKAFIAATAALCVFAHSAAASTTLENPNDTRVQTKRQSLPQISKSHARATHSKTRQRATRAKSRRYATHLKKQRAAIRRVTSGSEPDAAREFSGVASFYWEGDRVATGARYNPDGLTCAHRTLPFGTRLQVTDLVSKRSVVVTVNDRGPFVAGRILDLSRGAANVLGMTDRGITRIRASVM